MSKERYCAIDIGSNAMRAVFAKVKNNEIYCFKNYRYPLRLGADVFKYGKITSERLKITEDAFGELFLKLSKHGVENVKASATSAIRDSLNGEYIIDRIKKQTGIEIEVIDGMKEAQLIKNIIDFKFSLKNKTALLIDIGGGSTEITLTQNSKIITSRSYQFGTVRLLESHKLNSIEEDIIYFCENVNAHLAHYTKHIDICFGTGGNLRRMGKLRNDLLGKSSTQINVNELESILLEIEPYSIEKRMRLFNMRRDRADVIIPAMQMIEHLLHYTNIDKIHLPRVGLKEGILLNMVQPKPDKIHLAIKGQ